MVFGVGLDFYHTLSILCIPLNDSEANVEENESACSKAMQAIALAHFENFLALPSSLKMITVLIEIPIAISGVANLVCLVAPLSIDKFHGRASIRGKLHTVV